MQAQNRRHLAAIAYSEVARPRGFEPPTSAFGGLRCIRESPYLSRHSSQKDAERNENTTRLRGHSADACRCSLPPVADNRDDDAHTRAPESGCRWRGNRLLA